MTFSDICNNAACETSIEKKKLTIGQALERCLSRAVAAQRVTVGIQECAKLLGCAPERVMLCVIPDMSGSADVGLHIQQTLVRSFCWENDIRLLTVRNCPKLQSLVHCADPCSTQGAPITTCPPPPHHPPHPDTTTTITTTTTTNNNISTTSSTPSCLLLEVPAKEDVLNADEEFVCNYHDTVIYSDIYPKPIIQLPV